MSSQPSTQVTTIALIQMSCLASKQDNVDKAIGRIEDAAGQGAEIVCLPELFHNQYPCQREDHHHFDQAEPLSGPTVEALQSAAARHAVTIIGSIFERRAAGLYHNTAVVIGRDGRQIGVYRKMHIPDDPFYYEKFYFTPGDLGFRSFQTSHGFIGVCICWDQWFPEAARLTALAGAGVIFYPTAIGWLVDEKDDFGASQVTAWETMLRSHAIANGVFVAASNRTGMEGQLEFWGSSLVVDPYGNVLARGATDGEETLVVECDLASVEVARTHWPFLRDRRIDAYDGLLKRYLDRSTESE